MNNSNFNITAETIDTIVYQAYETYVYDLITTSAFALICYAAVLNIGHEVEYMWRKRFSLPTLLYLFTRYGSIIIQGINLAMNFALNSLQVCILDDVINPMALVTSLGLQGLLIARAYSLSRGNKLVAGVLGLSFALSIIISLLENIKFDGCSYSNSTNKTELITLTSIHNFGIIFIDLVVFSVCMWKVWGTFKLKRMSGIKSSEDLVFTLVKQGGLRCCFVLVSQVTCSIIEFVFLNRNTPYPVVLTSIFYYQNSFSAILVADFTLDLRRQNATEVDRVTLPTLQIQTLLQHVHQSVIVELRTPEDTVYVDTEAQNNSENADGAVNENTSSDRQNTQLIA